MTIVSSIPIVIDENQPKVIFFCQCTVCNREIRKKFLWLLPFVNKVFLVVMGGSNLLRKVEKGTSKQAVEVLK